MLDRHGLGNNLFMLATLGYSHHTSFLQGRRVNAETRAITYDGTRWVSHISPIGETLKITSILETWSKPHVAIIQSLMVRKTYHGSMSCMLWTAKYANQLCCSGSPQHFQSHMRTLSSKAYGKVISSMSWWLRTMAIAAQASELSVHFAPSRLKSVPQPGCSAHSTYGDNEIAGLVTLHLWNKNKVHLQSYLATLALLLTVSTLSTYRFASRLSYVGIFTCP